MLTRRPMMALLAIVVMLLASVFVTPTYAHSFIRRRATHPGPPRIVERSSPNPDRTTHYVSRSAPRLEDAITPAAMRKREPKAVSQAGGLALPLNLRARKAESSGHLQTRSRIPTSKTSYSEEYIKGMLDVTPHVGKNGGSGNGQKWSSNDDSGGGGGGGGVPPPAQIPLDYDIELNVTLDGIPTQLTVSGGESSRAVETHQPRTLTVSCFSHSQTKSLLQAQRTPTIPSLLPTLPTLVLNGKTSPLVETYTRAIWCLPTGNTLFPASLMAPATKMALATLGSWALESPAVESSHKMPLRVCLKHSPTRTA